MNRTLLLGPVGCPRDGVGGRLAGKRSWVSVVGWIGLVLVGWGLLPAGAQPAESGTPEGTASPTITIRTEEGTAPTPAYRESALRRFEIVTLTALPFTAIHTYLVVRGIKMISAGSFAADLEGSDWNWVGVGALAYAVGVGVYDYLRMRGKDRNAPLLPESPVPQSPTSWRPGTQNGFGQGKAAASTVGPSAVLSEDSPPTSPLLAEVRLSF